MDPGTLAEIQKFCEIADQKNEDSPFLVFDVDDVVWKVKHWREKMPRIDPHYAVKCNGDHVLLRTLAALKVGFDCASKVEIETIVNLDVPADRIIYANTIKGFSHLRRAAELKVDFMTFDCEEELLKIKDLYPSAKLILRLKMTTSSGFIKMNDKFGCDEAEVPHLLDVALKQKLSVVGVSFHIGCMIKDPYDYAIAIKMCRKVFDTAEKKGITMYILDIGGGFSGFKPSSSDKKETFAEIAAVINQVIDEHFPSNGSFKIIAEPGRYFALTAFTLCSKIIGKKKRFIDNEEDTMYIINEGVYGLFIHRIFHDIKPVMKEISSSSKPKRSSVWGQSCDPLDVILEKCMMPDLKVGDWIVFEEMGAYTIACASNFNGFEKAKVERVASQKTLTELEKMAGSETSRILYEEIKLKEMDN
ncbi:Ornithine decarboxylase-like protein [Argiope bruennichi]|uniref:Ornithine decarboxylase-like protein n=1 Tax=Argiope bruennichi TaxID=94029 RepID=A0A8T0ET46_ARGBR|nr:Ornithine decarboxylase-like protein [Argiope bruennichi]